MNYPKGSFAHDSLITAHCLLIMAKLELKNLRKQFSPKVIPVRDVSLTVDDGEFLCLLGPSGCGKSTLLRLIAGLDRPTQGDICLGDNSIKDQPPGDRNMAMVFQSYALYPHMTAEENIATALKLRRLSSEEINTRIEQAAKQLKLIEKDKNWLPYKPGKLSGGQRQRVALARALVRKPDVFLLDEPLSNLDALLREQVRAELKQIFKQQNRPVVYVTHDQTEAMTLSTKVAVLYDGLVQQLDTPYNIYHYPNNQFVAGFVGSPQMNLLSLDCENNQAILGNFRVKLPDISSPPPQQIILGIRPEDITITDSTNANAILSQVILVEQLGKENLVMVQIKNAELTLNVLLPNDQNWEGEELPLIFPEHQIHWFSWNGDPEQAFIERHRLNVNEVISQNQ
ncbi:MAG: ABC transporter ATP-binding protein [Microcystaceae cyanobacterium]